MNQAIAKPVKTEFFSASEVRKFCKDNGFPNVKVKWMNNPFGGSGKFFVKAKVSNPTAGTISASDSTKSETQWSSSDSEVSKVCGEMEKLLRENTKNASFDGIVN